MQKTLGYRIKNVLLALIVFVLMIDLPTIMSGVVLGVVESVSFELGGYRMLQEAYFFLLDNMNLFSVVVYVLFGAPVLLWVLVMRWRGRRAARVAQAAQATQAAQASQAPQVARVTTQAQMGETEAFPADPPTASGTAPTTALVRVDPTAMPEQVSFRVHGIPRSAWVDSALLALGLQFLTTLIMVLILITLPAAMEEYESLIDDSGITQYGIMWFISTVVLPPLVEETGFRGLGLTYLKRAGIPFAVANVLQAVAFGIFHMNLTQGIYTFVLGLFMGYVAHRTGSVVPAMLLHAVYNLMGTLGTEVLYALVPWFPFWLEVAIGLLLTVLAMLSLRDRGGRPVASS